MSVAARIGDMSAGHCFFPRPNTQGSSNVIINGLPAHCIGMSWPIHNCGKFFHPSFTAMGSPNVLVNGLPLARVGDMLSCGDMIASGSPNVLVN
jgi:uncharacterized Zn-binding protein involved in type VI secretion